MIVGQLLETEAERFELDPGDLGIELGRQGVDLGLELFVVLDQPLRGECLVGEREIHDIRRMAFGGAQIDQAALGCDQDAASVRHAILVQVGTNRLRAAGHLLERSQLEFDIEVAGVGEDRPVAHPLEVTPPKNVLVARHRDEDVADLGGIVGSQNAVAVHDGGNRPNGVDLDDDHVGSEPTCPIRNPLSAVSVTDDDNIGTGDEDVRCSDDSIHRRLASPVTIVEQVLRLAVIDCDDRHPQRAVFGHRPEPDHARRGLLGRSDRIQLGARRVQDGRQIRPVVHGDVRLEVEHRVDVAVVGV